MKELRYLMLIQSDLNSSQKYQDKVATDRAAHKDESH